MHYIQNSYISTPSLFNKVIAGFTCVLAITVIALSIIGITATSTGPFNAIVQLGTTTNGILLGTSIFAFILDLVWIATLCKKTKGRSSVEEINELDLLSQLPEEIILKVFYFLSIKGLIRCTEVSRRWKRLASDKKLWNAFDLRKIFSLLKVFDESDWNTYVDLSLFGLTTRDVLSIDKRKAIPALTKLLTSLPKEIEGDAGVTLLTIPKGLTFNKLIELAASLKVGKITRFSNIWDRISNEIGDIPVDQTYRIVITNNVFKNSRNLSFDDQKALVKKFDCKTPKVLQATVLLVVTFMRSGEYLYSDSPFTYTRCSEKLYEGQLVVGGFSPAGVYILAHSSNHDCYGVGGVLRKLYADD